MNAIELADYFDNADGSVSDADVSAMLRKQDAAIKQLREALNAFAKHGTCFDDEDLHNAKSALAATENLT